MSLHILFRLSYTKLILSFNSRFSSTLVSCVAVDVRGQRRSCTSMCSTALPARMQALRICFEQKS